MTRIVVATGTSREASVLRRSDWTVIAGGGDPARLRAELSRAADQADAILSFGMAGALDPALKIGDWVIGDRVTGGIEAVCDPRLQAWVAAVLPSATGGKIYADGRMIADAGEKSRLAERSRAVAVDMESHIAAAVARERGLPFAVLRCVSDRADQSLPPAFAVAMRPDGGLAVGAMVRSIVSRPSQVGSVLRTGFGFARAMRSLADGGKVIGVRMPATRHSAVIKM